MRKTWNFKDTTPAGEFAPFFPAGLGVGVVTKAEDHRKKGEDVISGFFVTVSPHPSWMAKDPRVKPNMAGRVYGAYKDDNGFTMKMFMDILDKTAEVISSATFDFDPVDPLNGLTNKLVYYEARPMAREDSTVKGKFYDDLVILSRKEWDERLAKQTAEAAQKTAAGAVSLNPTAPAAPPPVQNGISTSNTGASTEIPGLPPIP